MLTRKVLRRIAVLVWLAPAVFVCWQIVTEGVSVWELMVTVVGALVLFVPASLVAATIIAYFTREWAEWWKDLVLAAGGFSLFYLGIYGAFYTTQFSLLGKIIGVAGIVLTTATIALTPFRRVFKKRESNGAEA